MIAKTRLESVFSDKSQELDEPREQHILRTIFSAIELALEQSKLGSKPYPKSKMGVAGEFNHSAWTLVATCFKGNFAITTRLDWLSFRVSSPSAASFISHEYL
jgi:hypothetical protein